ncbi:2-phosphosulfolactate phosphatase [Nakamurella sp. YIM 132087]|uniref:Probable 2-phosphosulfolactate phosphatase n=1 Tax=Nakamurella alba TaxID=2665158 RepID=A0A7K1FER3_9ACTN|nr:2-phosphosulfolactate phosphatase [Nakamurella alba]MTD12591.1 2-phosphosulfolactate phosphatase [Nakamurella alba]
MTAAPTGAHQQAAARIRCDWGLPGATAISEGAGVVVVVDVLSFTTTLSVAVENDLVVHPYLFRDASAASFAAQRGAMLAVGRSEAGETGISLSPLSIRRAVEQGRLSPGDALVLPSPNGSAISKRLADGDAAVVGACLRNARSVAAWAWAHAGDRPIAVVAAGERWPGDQLRPAVEDLWGAGAVIAALLDAGLQGASPEAEAAAAGYRALLDPLGVHTVQESVPAMLRACASGQELIGDGWGDEIDVAAELDMSTAVPVLDGEVFRAGSLP